METGFIYLIYIYWGPPPLSLSIYIRNTQREMGEGGREREMGEGGREREREGEGGGGTERERDVPPVEQIKFNHSK